MQAVHCLQACAPVIEDQGDICAVHDAITVEIVSSAVAAASCEYQGQIVTIHNAVASQVNWARLWWSTSVCERSPHRFAAGREAPRKRFGS